MCNGTLRHDSIKKLRRYCNGKRKCSGLDPFWIKRGQVNHQHNKHMQQWRILWPDIPKNHCGKDLLNLEFKKRLR
ncbi:hypothetical protein ANN_24654 [Periplaneta americana]|uniref:Uncharacterized protein n=1 Tax=Periplaneta americana TaxID=6978 RepID=A0ABQ8S4D7_PERAM|nr:hypothetical protein ANN_24654 [Periplaneta americana]